MRLFIAQKYRVFFLFCVLILIGLLTACGSANGGNSSSGAKPGASAGTGHTSGSTGGNATIATTPTAQVQAGPRACPTAIGELSYWDPIVITQIGVNAVSGVICGNLTGSNTIQAIVTVTYQGTGQVADVYVFDNITSPNPTRLFFLQGLYRGSVKLSAYGTILTAEVDQGSSINQSQSGATYQQDLFREFQWSDGAGTFIPVSFPGIFPDLTRYQAESDQQQVNKGTDTWKLDAAGVASRLASQLLNWTVTSSTLTSGGGKHDSNAVVTVKSSAGGTIQVTLGRLEGNVNAGIWEATGVTSASLTVNAPQNRDVLHNPFTMTGTRNTVGGHTGTIMVLDHLYSNVTKGSVNVTGSTFTSSVSYTVSFKTGFQEGLVVLDTGTGASILKELLS